MTETFRQDVTFSFLGLATAFPGSAFPKTPGLSSVY